MKKGVAILLIAIMLLTGMQPVLSLHLCAGSLFSVTLFDEAEGVSCCEMNSCCEMPLQAAHNIANDKDIRPQTCCKMPMQAAPEISAGQRHSDIEQRHSTTEKKQSARDQRHSTTEQRHSATNASTEINFIHEDCCEFQTLEISTDEFTRDAEQQTTQNLTQLTDLWTVIIALLQKIAPDNSLTLTQLFPPSGLSRLTTDLLTFICIYRI
jgi:hypothetical protein